MPPTPPGSVPPPHGFPPPSGGPSGYPGPAFPSRSWQQPQGPRRGNGWKWALGTVALVAVVGVTAAVTSTVVHKEGESTSPSAEAPTSATGGASAEIASSDDTRPVTVIAEDPSCAAATPILETRAAIQRNGWDKRDASLPAAAWSAEVRAQYEAVAQSMRLSADQLVPVAKLTPHRVMRELYEQIIAYSRAYAESVSAYTPEDNAALVSTNASTAVSLICVAIKNGSAAARGPLTVQGPTRSDLQQVGDVSSPGRFLTEPNPECSTWEKALNDFDNDTVQWRAISADIPAGEWTPEQKSITDAVIPVMRRLATQQVQSGEQSGNAVWRDFADLSAQYRLAYAEALPTYVASDDVLSAVSLRLGSVVSSACRLVEK
ncbi:Uncharacterised protein [Mycolicibacterium smegmatis]|nr:Uncharacterised protein [Mycolicibacterium smegmatis]